RGRPEQPGSGGADPGIRVQQCLLVRAARRGNSERREEEEIMQQSRWIAGVLLLGACLTAPDVRAQNQPPPAPPAGPGAAQPGPGTPGGGRGQPPPPVPLPGIRTVMVFPFENNTASGGRPLGLALADAVQRGMEASRVYGTVMYNENLVLVRRAKDENSTVMT